MRIPVHRRAAGKEVHEKEAPGPRPRAPCHLKHRSHPTMKKLLLCGFAAAALLSFPACTTTVEEHHGPAHTSTTTTEETTVRRPVGASVETTTLRSY